MKVIVTGSHGFIGMNLCKRLNKLGIFTHEVDLKVNRDLFSIPNDVFKEARAIFHLACMNQEVAEREPISNLITNADSCQFLAERAKVFDLPLYYTSSCSVYGQAKTIPTSTLTKTNPLTGYAVAKLAGEQLIRISGCRYKIFRLSNVYGPYQTPDNPYCGVIGKFVDSYLENQPLRVIAPGSQTRDFTYVDDVVNAILTNDLPINGTFNVSHGREYSVMHLATLLNNGIEIIPKRSVDLVNRRCLVSDYKCPTGLETGLQKTIEWYRNAS
jgi:UDP-glucose 4-epimerase